MGRRLFATLLYGTINYLALLVRKDYIWTKKGLIMKLSESVKSISYLKANAANLIEESNKYQKTFVITQNGEAKVVVQDIKTYEKMQETMAMLKLLAMTSEKDNSAKDIKSTFSSLREELKSLQ